MQLSHSRSVCNDEALHFCTPKYFEPTGAYGYAFNYATGLVETKQSHVLRAQKDLLESSPLPRHLSVQKTKTLALSIARICFAARLFRVDATLQKAMSNLY